MVIGRAIDTDYSKLTIALQQVVHTEVRTPGSGPTFGHVLINKMPGPHTGVRSDIRTRPDQ